MSDESHIKLGLRVPKSRSYPVGWKRISSIPPDQPCIVALPGSSTDNSRKANCFAKMVRQIFRDCTFPVYSVEYEYGGRVLRIDREAVLARYGQENPDLPFIKYVKEEDKTYIPQYIHELYAKTIAARLRDKDGNKLPLAQAAQQLNMLIWINHCQGTTAFFLLEQLAKQDMEKLGYTEKHRDYLLKQMHAVDVAPVTPYGITQTTTYKFISLDDNIAMSVQTPQIKYIQKRKNEHKRYIESISSNETEPKANNKPFIMPFCLFQPTRNETVFAVNNLYPTEIQQQEEYDGIEHTFDSYTDEIDDERTKQGDLMNRTLHHIINRLVDHAKKNQKTLTELPDIYQEPQFKALIKQTQNNRYNFITRETALLRTRRNQGK